MDKTLTERVCNSAKNLRGLYFNTNCSPDGFRVAVEDLADDADKLLAALASDTAGAPENQQPYTYVYEWDTPHGLHRDCQYGTYNGSWPHRTVALYAAPVDPAATSVEQAVAATLERAGESHEDAVRMAREAVAADAAAPEELPECNQDWANVSPEVAFHLIDRHAENWAHAGQLMEAWRSAANARDAAEAQPDERAAFEAWAVQNGMHDLTRHGSDEYLRDPVNICWLAWQACATQGAKP